jgi:REP-associated tyrosine transposase
MPRRKVNFRAGEYYHVYNRGHNRDDIFFERENYLFFLRKVRDHLTRECCDVITYCLMPNHYHRLVKLRTPEFSKAMMSFGLSYVKAINKRFERFGPLFQGPFSAIHVDDEPYLIHLSRYIHLNPVAADFVEHPEDWEYSSYRDFVGMRKGTLPSPQTILAQFDSVEGYQRFVKNGIGKDDRQISHLIFDEKA